MTRSSTPVSASASAAWRAICNWVISGAVDGKVDTSAWRFQPEKVGSSLCTNDLGTHAEQMVAQFTGLHVKRVLAMMDTYPRDLPLDTNVNVLMDFGGAA